MGEFEIKGIKKIKGINETFRVDRIKGKERSTASDSHLHIASPEHSSTLLCSNDA